MHRQQREAAKTLRARKVGPAAQKAYERDEKIERDAMISRMGVQRAARIQEGKKLVAKAATHRRPENRGTVR